MASDTVAKEFELKDYLRILGHRVGMIVVLVLLVTGGAVAFSSSRTPVYEAVADVLLQPRSTDTLFGLNSVRDPARVVQTEIRLIQSKGVRDAVTEKLGSAPPAAARQAGDTEIIQVTARDLNPERAAEIANAYASAYIDFRRTQSVGDVIAAATQVQGKLTELQRSLNSASGPERQALLDQQALFKQKLDELQVDGALKTGGAQMATPASPPQTPVSPRPLRAGVTAMVGGLMLAIALAFFLEYLDDSVQSSEDIEKVPGGPPVVGRIPVVSGWKPRDKPIVVSSLHPKSFPAEAYRALRTAVHFVALDRPIRTLQITSASASEGKTTTLANLAVAMSAAGLRVLVVCCDLRRPRIHTFFGLDNAVGFTSVLMGRESVSSALQPVPGHGNLFLMASGQLPPNPSELLASARTAELLTSLELMADIVLIDCPPVLPVTDALVLSGRVDATLLVCVAGATTRKEVARSVEELRRVEAPLVGAVLNGVRDSDSYGGGYGYAYHEHNPDKGLPRRSASLPESPIRAIGDGRSRASGQERYEMAWRPAGITRNGRAGRNGEGGSMSDIDRTGRHDHPLERRSAELRPASGAPRGARSGRVADDRDDDGQFRVAERARMTRRREEDELVRDIDREVEAGRAGESGRAGAERRRPPAGWAAPPETLLR